MIKILFVCYGNICRSPMAEYVLKDIVKKQGKSDEFYIDSAATSREEIGNGVHYGTVNKLKELNIPCGNHKARQITENDYKEFDYIIGMEESNIKSIKRIIGKDKENKIHRLLDFSKNPRDISDPWYTGNFDKTYNDIIEGIDGLLQFLQKNK